MFKNKIYNYISLEFIKSFVLILFSLSLIAWTVRAVNFLDLIVDSGYSTSTYFTYSLLNLTNIMTKFIPLSFLLALLLTIIRLERQNELLVLWTSGIAKSKITNLFFLLSVSTMLFYILFSTIITPNALNKSRGLIKQSGVDTVTNLLKPNAFSDAFKGLTFYIGEKEDNIIKNIFIKDDGNNLNSLLPENSTAKNKTVIAEKGVVKKNKIILENGFIQSYENNDTVKIIQFNKTLLNFSNLDNRVIKDVKIQETSTYKILNCLKDHYYNQVSETYVKNCPKNNIAIVIENFSRRFLMPLYIPLVSILISFVLIYTKNKKTKILNRYIFFTLSFTLLVLSELLVRYSGISNVGFYIYSLTPIALLPILYLILINKFSKELK
ncbi:MAG: hypothetical protein CMI78_00700 [Candidatus Pelagibacter sp.]|nr:hypothetical protein [Candidatus Pelagibacter sp.]OUW68445.1 MAG: hypothetical protein CBD62_01815 [Candidatus Pelagibacter sp. TMED202]